MPWADLSARSRLGIPSRCTRPPRPATPFEAADPPRTVSARRKDGHMTDGDVQTRSKRGQWVNRVVGEEDLSQSFSSREEAVEAGRTLAEELGTTHTVME